MEYPVITDTDKEVVSSSNDSVLGLSSEIKSNTTSSPNIKSVVQDTPVDHSKSQYEGDFIDETPEPKEGYQVAETLKFPNPFLLVCFFDPDIAEGEVTLYPWQMEVNENLGNANPSINKPYKLCLLASNGSGKDKFIIAPFVVWFILTKIRSRCIITTSSGTQLTSQTEPYIKDLCEKVNKYFGQEVFKIRQRYIKCLLTGSEVRMFATDEAGKAEGYHPIDAKSEMAIIVNEAKSVTEDIHRALRRCTGYNYWLEISSAGEPKGFLYNAYTDESLNFHTKEITSYDCPHQSVDEIEADKKLDGEHSAFFRSKHLSKFTSISSTSVIPMELVNSLVENPPQFEVLNWPLRVGIDLAAGGDENALCFTRGNKIVEEIYFRSVDTTETARRIAKILRDKQLDFEYKHIYADDGGVGRPILDMLADTKTVGMGWNINRILNQSPALGDKKRYGNRGAENWWRIFRILEEKYFDISGLTKKTIEQLYTRNYKQSLLGQKLFLESKKEAKAHGRLSPDRADAFILSLTGLTVEDFQKAFDDKKVNFKLRHKENDKRPREVLVDAQAVLEHYENKVTFSEYGEVRKELAKRCNRVYGSLQRAMRG